MADDPVYSHDLDDLDPAVADLARASDVILAAIDEGADDAIARSWRAAIALAALGKARLVLLDRADTTYADTPRVFELTREEVASAGDRQYLLDAIDEATAANVSTTAFQHSLPGNEALTDAAEQVNADLLVVPHHLDAPGLLNRLKGTDIAEQAEAAAPRGTSVVAVDSDGSLSVLTHD